MPVNKPSLTPLQPPEKKHHRLAVALLLLVIIPPILWFFGLTSYYIYIERFGTPEQRKELFDKNGERFSSTVASSRGGESIIQEDIRQFIREYSPQTGNEDADITILTFIDFECPFCRNAYPAFQNVRQQFGPAVNIVFKHFPISVIHPHAEGASIAASCADEQGKFWEYYERLFETQDVTESALFNHAGAVGLNILKFSDCFRDDKQMNNISQDLEDGLELNVRGTPTYFVNNVKLEGVVDEETWKRVIVSELQKITNTQ